MADITFKETFKIVVYLDGSAVGSIRKTPAGKFQYRAHGGSRGEAYDTLEACKASLEGGPE